VAMKESKIETRQEGQIVTNEELQAIRHREMRATPGPWFHGKNTKHEHNVYGPQQEDITPAFTDQNYGRSMVPEDATFIANARTDIPALLDELDSLRRRIGTSIRAAEELAVLYPGDVGQMIGGIATTLRRNFGLEKRPGLDANGNPIVALGLPIMVDPVLEPNEWRMGLHGPR
jgi:hypothetical protein